MSFILSPSLYPHFRVYADGVNLKSISLTLFNFVTRTVVTYSLSFSAKADNNSETFLESVTDTVTDIAYSVSYEASTGRYNVDGLVGFGAVSVVGSYLHLYFDFSTFVILDILRTTTTSTDARIYRLELSPDTDWNLIFSGLLQPDSSLVASVSEIKDFVVNISGTLSTLTSFYVAPSINRSV